MIALGIDSSAKVCSVALVSDRLLAIRTHSDGLTHSQTLLPAVKEVLAEAGLSLSDLDVIAVSAGPGSFTGLRIGISTVKGLAFADAVPCAAVSTLEALAMNALSFEGAVICPVMDARRGEFYNALFTVKSGELMRLVPDRAISGEALSEELRSFEKVLILGDGAVKFTEAFPSYLPNLAAEEIRLQNGESVARLGLREAETHSLVPCSTLSPRYLRLPQAEREWLAKNIKDE